MGGSVGRALSRFFGVFLWGGQPPIGRRTGTGSGSASVSAPTLIGAVRVSRPVPSPEGRERVTSLFEPVPPSPSSNVRGSASAQTLCVLVGWLRGLEEKVALGQKKSDY